MTFNLDKMDIKIIKEDIHGLVYIYNNKKYFYKKCNNMKICYNELIAEKIANQMNIPCCHYIFSEKDGFIGVSSEMIINENYMSMKDFLNSVYGTIYKINPNGQKQIDTEYETKNTLESIWHAIELKYKNKSQEKVFKVMDSIVKIFMFDILIGNSDRHTDNLGLIVTDDNVEVAKIYDNEEMLSEYALYDGEYSIHVENEDINDNVNSIDKFLKISSTSYTKELIKYLKIISKDNIELMFKELEKDGVYVDRNIKTHILKEFELNTLILRKHISNYISQNTSNEYILKRGN